MKLFITTIISLLLMTSFVYADTVVTADGIVFDKETGTVIDIKENELTKIIIPTTIEDVVVSGVCLYPINNKNVKKLVIPETVTSFHISMAGNEIDTLVFLTKNFTFDYYLDDFDYFYAGGRSGITVYGYVNSPLFDLHPQWYYKFVALDENIQQGDINCDGVVDASDSALLLQKVLVNSIIVKADYLTNKDYVMDLSGDGSITAKDSTFILQKVLNG